MVIRMTSTVEISIQVVSPLSGVGAAGAAAAAASVAAGAVSCAKAASVPSAVSASVPSKAVLASGAISNGSLILFSMNFFAGSKRVGVGLAGADAHGLVDRIDKDLAVADLPGLGGPGDGVDGL